MSRPFDITVAERIERARNLKKDWDRRNPRLKPMSISKALNTIADHDNGTGHGDDADAVEVGRNLRRQYKRWQPVIEENDALNAGLPYDASVLSPNIDTLGDFSVIPMAQPYTGPKGGVFDPANNRNLISGFRFPDLVAMGLYGPVNTSF